MKDYNNSNSNYKREDTQAQIFYLFKAGFFSSGGK